MQGLLFKVSAIAVIAVTAILIIRQLKGELSFAVKVISAVLILGLTVASLEPVINDITSVFITETSSEYIRIMLKAAGIAFLTHISSSICKDCGENTLSVGVELAGKIEILILCLPLIEKIMGYLLEMISMGE